jgi:hypothetical protein
MTWSSALRYRGYRSGALRRAQKTDADILVFLTRESIIPPQQFRIPSFCSKTSQGVLYAQKARTPHLMRISLIISRLSVFMNRASTVRTPGRRYEIAAAGLLILAVAVYFAYAALWSYAWQWKAHSLFLPVEATVIETSVQSRGSASTTHGQSFSPHIVYRYSVGGVTYESSRYFFMGDGWSDFVSAESVAAQFPLGSSVQVYVDAAGPEQAVIDRSKPKLGILLYVLPLSLSGFAAIVYGLLPRKER